MTLAEYELADRTTRDDGTVFLTGVQALARLPVEQLRVDRLAGLNTAAFASGYPGSPLAGLDMALEQAAGQAPELPIVLRPALNEELGVSAVMGSQLAASRPDAIYDGVVGLWYGKAPGLDRSSDALRHAVYTGTSPGGGAVAIVGDDPAAKSSTLPSSSDATFVDLHLPILYPGDVSQALDLGRHAIALSRASGLWVGLKVVSAVADGTGSVALDPTRVSPKMPTVDGEPYECRPDALLLGAHSMEIERELRGIRTEIAVRYGELNQLNRLSVRCDDAWLGIIASGVTHRELMEALRRLGLDTVDLANGGIRVLEMQMPIPFSTEVVRDFARGLEEVMVVEEMNPTLARLIRDCLYGAVDRPFVTGKVDRHGAPQFPDHGPLTADRIVGPLRRALEGRLGERMTPRTEARRRIEVPLNTSRSPAFCSGCPHNLSTRTPEGTVVGAGIGCHTMALLSDDPRLGEIVSITAMGNEGAPWIGLSPFVQTPHLTQNLGDGTYFHSGQLAVQAAVDAGVDVTFKILLNGHVAMTGGQLPPGQLDVAGLARVLLTQGVAKIIVTTDDVKRVRGTRPPAGVDVWDRARIIEAQEALAATPGVTVMVHDQPCTAALRKQRKRGTAPTPETRLLINEEICEGCGDCAERSSCLSLHPVETAVGTKTRIDQSSCNIDTSCLDGDCPSFVSVRPARARRFRRLFSHLRRPEVLPELRSDTPTRSLPTPPDMAEPAAADPPSCEVRLAGIGGTGVVTVSQVLGTAAMLEGRFVRGLDQTGLSQKAGPVVSDVLIASESTDDATNHIGEGRADVMLALDTVVGASQQVLAATSPGTRLVGSTSRTPTASMVSDPRENHDDWGTLVSRIEGACDAGAIWLDATAVATHLVGNAATANMVVLGAAFQAGLLPVAWESLVAAVELNGVAAAANTQALRWGRCAVADPDHLAAALGSAVPVAGTASASDGGDPATGSMLEELSSIGAPDDLIATVTDRIGRIVDYQGVSLADTYRDLMLRTAACEQQVAPGCWDLTSTVAVELHRVMTYKDEYEVARLLTDEPTMQAARRLVDGPAVVHWNLHPPLLRAMGVNSKMRVSSRLAPAMRVLARGKALRGRWFDPFGHTAVRRAERRLAGDYQAALEDALDALDSSNHRGHVERLGVSSRVRGYEDRKLAAISEACEELDSR
ncbi:MAG: indolepyruvate ferredoxin oxidoreductase family protein [Microthrixaceae bacterium]